MKFVMQKSARVPATTVPWPLLISIRGHEEHWAAELLLAREYFPLSGHAMMRAAGSRKKGRKEVSASRREVGRGRWNHNFRDFHLVAHSPGSTSTMYEDAKDPLPGVCATN